jgi:hypothetical protein
MLPMIDGATFEVDDERAVDWDLEEIEPLLHAASEIVKPMVCSIRAS